MGRATIQVLLPLVLVAALTGCGGKTAASPSPTASAPMTTAPATPSAAGGDHGHDALGQEDSKGPQG
jgi:hypothetical protein